MDKTQDVETWRVVAGWGCAYLAGMFATVAGDAVYRRRWTAGLWVAASLAVGFVGFLIFA